MADSESGSGESAGGRPEVISGTARNARAGAVLLADDGRHLYVEGLDSWDADLLGKRLTLTGVVRRGGHYPAGGVDEDGLLVQGMVGTPLVLQLTEPIRRRD
jgi:hypothetical protein